MLRPLVQKVIDKTKGDIKAVNRALYGHRNPFGLNHKDRVQLAKWKQAYRKLFIDL